MTNAISTTADPPRTIFDHRLPPLCHAYLALAAPPPLLTVLLLPPPLSASLVPVAPPTSSLQPRPCTSKLKRQLYVKVFNGLKISGKEKLITTQESPIWWQCLLVHSSDNAATTWPLRRRWACCRTMLRASTVGEPREFEGNEMVGKLPLAEGGWFG
ncbi:hypothetical protein BUALT_Bualt03G0159000 [Buddleja alternifolia]|uniref:Uncharacterized protein n=1 Tax=Buddleja alternifolia TaxID=168488 RepID=A0AAV6XYG8_9LAMI|nr:hypothetical protein BUALT_Bualt03G0159000 [Buddleja alternifolia]